MSSVTKKSNKVPLALNDKYKEIVSLTNDYADKHLDKEYKEFCQFLTAALARKKPSPLLKGKPNVWACGIIHALGFVNFLFDPNTKPFVQAAKLYADFGTSSSTGSNKSKQIRDMFDMFQMDPNWCFPSKLANNPLTWLVQIDGFMVDLRYAPRPIQEQAFEMGIIPFIPDGKIENT